MLHLYLSFREIIYGVYVTSTRFEQSYLPRIDQVPVEVRRRCCFFLLLAFKSMNRKLKASNTLVNAKKSAIVCNYLEWAYQKPLFDIALLLTTQGP